MGEVTSFLRPQSWPGEPQCIATARDKRVCGEPHRVVRHFAWVQRRCKERKKLCCPGAITQRWSPPTRYTLHRITSSIMRDLIRLYYLSTDLLESEVESRTQGLRPRPRTQKKSEAKDSHFEDRHSLGQGQKCSRPRTKDTSASALQKKKKSSQKFFKRSPLKNIFQKIFQALHKILTIQKIVLSSSRGQANFRGLEASRPRPRTSNLSSRTPPLIRTFQYKMQYTHTLLRK